MTSWDTNSTNERNNNNNSNINHNAGAATNRHQGPISILRDGTHQPRQQQVSIVNARGTTGSGGSGQGGQGVVRKLKTNKHTKGNRYQNSESPPSPPPSPSQSRNNKIHSFSLSYKQNLLKAKTKNVTAVIQETDNAIFKKTRCKATFSPTSKI